MGSPDGGSSPDHLLSKASAGLYEIQLRLCDMSWWGLLVQSLILTFTFVVLVALRRRYFSPISHIPGPFWASMTRLWHLWETYKGKQNLSFIAAHDQYGHFVRVAPNEVSLSHPNSVKAVLLSTLPKGQWYKIVCFPDYRFTTPFSMTDPKETNEAKKYLMNGYLQHNVLKSEPALDESIQKLTQWMDRYADSKEPMELDQFFTYTAFDITGEVVFSKPFGFLDSGKDVGGAIAMNLGLEIYIAFGGYFQWLHGLFANPFVTWLSVLPMGHLYDTTMTALNERQKNPEARFDLAAHWFRGLDRAVKEGSKIFNLRCLQAFATANVGAGSDTVSAGLQSFVYYLLRHDGGQGWYRIQGEIDAAQKEGRCQTSIISYEDAASLPYLQAAVKEGLRMFGPIGKGLPRVVPQRGVTVGEVTFPEGVELSINPWVMHYSTELWGPDAREFNPDRWLNPDIASKERNFIPWGAGYASCPGQHIARIQLYKIAATIVRDFDVRQVDPNQEWSWSAWFTAVPHDWPVYISRRK